jgi:phage tail protein X
MRVYAHQGDALDALVWRHLGRTAGLVEQALELNPGLCAHGPVLPHGTAVELPEITTTATAPERPLVQLWD